MRQDVIAASLLALLLTTPVQAKHVNATQLPHKKGMDPVSWSLSPGSGFPATTQVGSSYAVAYTLQNNLPFAVPLSVSGAYNGGKFSLSHGCNTTLAPRAACVVQVMLQPIQSGPSNAVVTLAYHHNRVPLPRISTNSVSVENSDKINGHVTIPLPAPAYIGVSYPVTFTFVNNGDNAVTPTAVNVSGFTANTNTCTGTFAPHTTCAVSGNFVPSVIGQVTLSVNYVENNGTVPLATTTNVINGSGNCHQISANQTLPLPTTTYTYTNNVIQYTFTNNCSATTEALGTVALMADNATATVTKGSDTCSNQTLAPTSSCSVFASVVPNTTAPVGNDLSVTASLAYNSNAYTVDSTSSETVNALTNQQSAHTLIMFNQCESATMPSGDGTVWYGFQNGSGGGNSPDPTPSPSTWQSYQLNPQLQGAAPAMKVLQFGAYTGGKIFGRTGCDTTPTDATYGVCNTANCTSLTNSTGRCGSAAPTSPATVYEETIVSGQAGDGVYDISVINGFNIPGEFRSLAPLHPIHVGSDFTVACGQSPGAVVQPSNAGIATCSWSFTPPSTGTDCTAGTQTDTATNYYFVPAGADDGCTPSTNCGTGKVCGMAWTPQPSTNPQYLGTPVTRRCGTFQGYWTVADWIAYLPNNLPTVNNWGSCDLYSHYSMATSLDSIKPASQPTYGNSIIAPNPLAQLADMFGCRITSNDSLDSGYDGGKINACGCIDWTQTPEASPCLSFNSLWTSEVLPRIQWLKNACPTVYTYQFDDKTAQYTCNVAGQETSYQITFCPAGKTGAPGT